MYWWKYGPITSRMKDETSDVLHVCCTPSNYQKLDMLMQAAFATLAQKGLYWFLTNLQSLATLQATLSE
jgi:hypothetical protein